MKEMVCIICPNSCTLSVEENKGDIVVSGNQCKRGEAFAKAELTHPMRTISSTVRTVYESVPVLPVRVSAEIPKERIFDVMKEMNKILVDKPVDRGEVLLSNVLSLGVDIIATSGKLKGEDPR
jgi:CxxC motif-containing protein